MVLRNPPLAEPVKYPGGVKNKPPFEMGVANFDQKNNIKPEAGYSLHMSIMYLARSTTRLE